MDTDITVCTFYSYKGGVGRTLALTYIAKYLAKKGYPVYIIDLDLEAPGASFKFQKTKSEKGATEYLTEGSSGDINDYFVTIEDNLKIMFAGANVLSNDYIKNVINITEEKFLFEAKGLSKLEKKIDEIQKLIKLTHAKRGFIFIDSRAGFTPLSVLTNVKLPKFVVMFIANNNESFKGSSRMHEIIRHNNSDENEFPIIHVISRIPIANGLKDGLKQRNIVKKFVKYMKDEAGANIKEENILCIRSDRNIEYNETALFDGFGYCSCGVCEVCTRFIYQDYKELIDKIMKKTKVKKVKTNFMTKHKIIGSTSVINKSVSYGNKIVNDIYKLDASEKYFRPHIDVMNFIKNNEFHFITYASDIDNSFYVHDSGKTIARLLDYNNPNAFYDLAMILDFFKVQYFKFSEFDNDVLRVAISEYFRGDENLEYEKIDKKNEEENRYRLYKCVLFLDRYVDQLEEIYSIAKTKRDNTIKTSPLIIKSENEYSHYKNEFLYSGGCEGQSIGYEFALVEINQNQYISDQGKTFETLVDQGLIPYTYIEKIGDSTVDNDYINGVLWLYGVQIGKNQSGSVELLRNISSIEKNSDQKAKELFECILFFETLHLFYR